MKASFPQSYESNLQEPGGPMMKQRFAVLILAVMAAALCVPPIFAQGTSSVKGTCRDLDGKPYVGATVEFTGTENGRKITLTTNKKGEYFSLGVATGTYNVALIVDGKPIYNLNKVPVTSDENVIDIDRKKDLAAGKGQMSEEDKKKLAEQEEKQ